MWINGVRVWKISSESKCAETRVAPQEVREKWFARVGCPVIRWGGQCPFWNAGDRRWSQAHSFISCIRAPPCGSHLMVHIPDQILPKENNELIEPDNKYVVP